MTPAKTIITPIISAAYCASCGIGFELLELLELLELGDSVGLGDGL